MPSGHFTATAGPLARSVRDCIEFFKVQCDEKGYLLDPFQQPSVYRKDMFDEMISNKSNIKIGILKETPFLPVS